MNEIALKLDLTTTEACRQLQRLVDTSLIQKLPDGAYTITNYGKLVLQLSAQTEFVFKNKEYFSEHNVCQLPTRFVNRIGELSKANLILDSMEGINRAEQLMLRAEKYLWGMGETQIPEFMGQIMEERLKKGLKIDVIVSEKVSKLIRDVSQGIEIRVIPQLPATIVCTEKEAAITLRLGNGKMDYSGLIGDDSTFVSWVKELFLYYWNKAPKISLTQ